MTAFKTTYCKFCGARAGTSHETWCPSNTDIDHHAALKGQR